MSIHKKIMMTISLISLGLLGYFLYYAGIFGSQLILTESSFDRLPNWQQDSHDKALKAFQWSCNDILKRKPDTPFGPLKKAGLASQWQTICAAAKQLKNPSPIDARQFFETWFDVYHVSNHLNHQGLFTGYYLPLLHGSVKSSSQYNVPIYGAPTDLIKIDLSLFNPELAGKKIVAQLKDQKLYPYPDRAAINQGALKHNAPIIAWCNNVIDLFFAQIQGSAILELENNQQVIINYANDNGRHYSSIGKILVGNQQLAKEHVSMQSIRAWLLAHPEEINTLLNKDASYVFFKILHQRDPLGSRQIPLSPERSLAVDLNYIPLGVPVWLDTHVPSSDNGDTLFQHLLIAQDTGGAIKGIVRGDVYWGSGEKAEFTAGHMKSTGQYWLLLPRMYK